MLSKDRMNQVTKLNPQFLLAFIMSGLLVIIFGIAASHIATAQQLNQNFVVDSTADAPDNNPGDNSCDDGSGNCTLRAAIMEANALIGFDTVTVPAGTYDITIAGSDNTSLAGDFDLISLLSITGDGPGSTIIRGGTTVGLDRVFELFSGSVVTISDLTIQNGVALDGGGVYNNLGQLTLSNVELIGNAATRNGGGVWSSGTLGINNSKIGNTDITDSNIANSLGGGVYNTGSATLDDSTVENNFATSNGGGVWNSGTLTLDDTMVARNTSISGGGGGILNQGTLQPSNSSTINIVEGNQAFFGGGIWNSNRMEFDERPIVIRGNMATNGSGGGIYSNGSSLTIWNSVIDHNEASGGGAGLYFNGGSNVITNVTISHNEATLDGGGIENNQGNLDVIHSTITENTASNGGGVSRSFHTLSLSNTIVANNPSGGDCDGSITSQGYNLDSDGSCNLSNTGDQSGVNPLLGPLQDNGGPTQTHALLSGSPAIDAVPIANCLDIDSNPLATDQRGVARPQGPACDIGTFESEQSPIMCNMLSATIVGTPGNDLLSGTPGNDVIAGLGGNDIINGLGGQDTICGGEGDDTISGGKQKDFIFGEAGNDVLNGNSGGDRIEGGDGEDTIDGGSSRDRLFGNKQNDILIGGIGNDKIKGGRGHDDLFGAEGDDKLRGQFGDDDLDCGEGNDIADGGTGTDTATPDCEVVSNVP